MPCSIEHVCSLDIFIYSFWSFFQGEDLVRESGIPYTIVRPCALTEEPAGANLIFDQGDNITVILSNWILLRAFCTLIGHMLLKTVDMLMQPKKRLMESCGICPCSYDIVIWKLTGENIKGRSCSNMRCCSRKSLCMRQDLWGCTYRPCTLYLRAVLICYYCIWLYLLLLYLHAVLMCKAFVNITCFFKFSVLYFLEICWAISKSGDL